MSDGAPQWLISVDDHIVEPPNLWVDRLPAKYRDVGPRVLDDGKTETWVYEDKEIPVPPQAYCAGRPREDFATPQRYAEMRPGLYDSVARLDDMNQDGVLASLCFPNVVVRFCGQTFAEGKDKELGLLCVRAYNDWMIEEWCGRAPGRFIPTMIVPLWDVNLAVQELERTAALGAKAFCFSENAAELGLPSIHDADGYWDPLWGVAAETGIPVCMHIGSSSKLPTTAADAPTIIMNALVPMNAMKTCVDWLFSGVFTRYPSLKICLSEGGIGWIPYVLERCDYTLDRQGAWARKADMGQFGMGGLGRALDIDLPSDVFRRNIFGCFIDDIFGAANLDLIGVDNVMIETDYPHSDSSFPNSIDQAMSRLKGRTDEEIYKIFQGNARRVFNFEPAEQPVLRQR